MSNAGERLPDVEVVASDGSRVKLRELTRDRVAVIYFYPKDDTLVCTAQACGFRDRYEDFVTAGAMVVGISSDPPSSHQAFAAKHRLPFTLVSDESEAARRALGVKPFFGHPGRTTFVVDRGGTIRLSFTSALRAGAHVDKALKVVRSLAAEAA